MRSEAQDGARAWTSVAVTVPVTVAPVIAAAAANRRRRPVRVPAAVSVLVPVMSLSRGGRARDEEIDQAFGEGGGVGGEAGAGILEA